MPENIKNKIKDGFIKLNGKKYKVIRDMPELRQIMVVDPENGAHICLDYVILNDK